MSFKSSSQLQGGWGRRPQGDAPSSEACALRARRLEPARPQPPTSCHFRSAQGQSRLSLRERRHLASLRALLGLPRALADGNGRRSCRRPGRWFRRQSRRRYRRWNGCGNRYAEYRPGCKRFVAGTGVSADEERPGPVRVSRSIGDVRRSDIGAPQPRSLKPIAPARGRHHENYGADHPACPSLPRRDFHHRTPSRDHSRELPAGLTARFDLCALRDRPDFHYRSKRPRALAISSTVRYLRGKRRSDSQLRYRDATRDCFLDRCRNCLHGW